MTLKIVLLAAVFALPLRADVSLDPGRRFPELSLPLIGGGKEVSISKMWEGKTMLHVFASW